MRIGIHYANFSHPGWPSRLTERLTETARVADEGGASWFTVMDHWFQMENLGGPREPMLEGYTTLGYLAGQTRNVRLSLLVTGATYRHPGLLVKTVTTLDVLSAGRAMLGVGAAWYEREHAGLGVPFPPMAERFDEVKLPGFFSDRTGVARYYCINREPLEKWKRVMSNPIRAAWCRRYLRWIGRRRLEVMGYDQDQMLREVNSMPRSARNLISDALRLPYGQLYCALDLQIVKDKLRLFRDWSRVVPHF